MNTQFSPTILLTRPRRQSEAARETFERLGLSVLIQPALEILPPDQWSAVDSALNRLHQFDWLIFSSANGVDFFLSRADEQNADLSSVRIAAMGEATAGRLFEGGLRADTVPLDSRAEGMVAALADEAARGARFLCVRADRGRHVLREGLEAFGGRVEEIAVYRSVFVEEADEAILRLMAEGRVHYTIVTSSAGAESLARLFGSNLKKTALVSISPLTSERLRSLGFEPKKEAAIPSLEGMAAVITEAFERRLP